MAITANIVVNEIKYITGDSNTTYQEFPIGNVVLSVLNNDAISVIGSGTTTSDGYKQITSITPTTSTNSYIYILATCTGYKTKIIKAYYATSSDVLWIPIRLVTDVLGGV